jgi:hypothetical protein
LAAIPRPGPLPRATDSGSKRKKREPKGRPLGAKNGTSALRRLARQFVDQKTGLSAEELIASRLIGKAIDGDLQAIKEYYDRTEGRRDSD